jgi:hypothetical protein
MGLCRSVPATAAQLPHTLVIRSMFGDSNRCGRYSALSLANPLAATDSLLPFRAL